LHEVIAQAKSHEIASKQQAQGGQSAAGGAAGGEPAGSRNVMVLTLCLVEQICAVPGNEATPEMLGMLPQDLKSG
jgi:hypothetical protein